GEAGDGVARRAERCGPEEAVGQGRHAPSLAVDDRAYLPQGRDMRSTPSCERDLALGGDSGRARGRDDRSVPSALRKGPRLPMPSSPCTTSSTGGLVWSLVIA